MNGLIKASLGNPYAVTVTVLTLVVLGTLTIGVPGVAPGKIPMDILPVYRSPAVQVLTFYGGMPAAGVGKDITNPIERWTRQAAGTKRQGSPSTLSATLIPNSYHEAIRPHWAPAPLPSLA